jgi:hypothetical protein
VKRHLPSTLRLSVLGCVLLALMAGAFIVVPNFGAHSRSETTRGITSEVSTIDPRSLAPGLKDLPVGTRLQLDRYVSTPDAARRNGTSLLFLESTGREIGFDRDFLVPEHGDVEVDIVRFRTHQGMVRAYSYFLTLPAAHGLADPIRTVGMGERAGVVITTDAAFLEFMRGRYYVVVTSVPGGRANLDLIGKLSKAVDRRILTFGLSA